MRGQFILADGMAGGIGLEDRVFTAGERVAGHERHDFQKFCAVFGHFAADGRRAFVDMEAERRKAFLPQFGDFQNDGHVDVVAVAVADDDVRDEIDVDIEFADGVQSHGAAVDKNGLVEEEG